MAELQEYKCPHCGGAITFDSSVQKMKCPYCDSEFEMETLKALDAELSKEKPDEINWQETTADPSLSQDANSEGLKSYVCNSCGGQIVCDATTAATSCPFCGNPVVLMGQFQGSKKPDLVIPFKLDKESAKIKLREHIKGKALIPKLFKDDNHIDEIKGIYVPFWLFDADADCSVRFNATKEKIWSDARFNYVETDYYRVTRAGQIGFSNVPVDGSSKMPDDLMESIEPYDMADAVDFQTAYLSGYMADRYDVLSKECVDRANNRIKETAEEAFRATVTGYNTVTTSSSSIRTTEGKVKYALLPVWLLNTSFEKATYTFAMNGQTGKFVGNLPLDKSLYHRYFAGITLISAVIFYLLATLFHFWVLWPSEPEPLDTAWILGSLIFGLVFAFAITNSMKSSLNSVRFQSEAVDYVRKNSMELSDSNDMFIYRNVATTPRGGAARHGIGRLGTFSQMGGPAGPGSFTRMGGMHPGGHNRTGRSINSSRRMGTGRGIGGMGSRRNFTHTSHGGRTHGGGGRRF